MKTCYIVTYDISDPDRLRRVYQTMKGAGEWIQYSVFLCQLSEREKEELISDLGLLIHAQSDQVLFIDLGPATGRARSCITALGKPYEVAESKATIL